MKSFTAVGRSSSSHSDSDSRSRSEDDGSSGDDAMIDSDEGARRLFHFLPSLFPFSSSLFLCISPCVNPSCFPVSLSTSIVCRMKSVFFRLIALFQENWCVNFRVFVYNLANPFGLRWRCLLGFVLGVRN